MPQLFHRPYNSLYLLNFTVTLTYHRFPVFPFWCGPGADLTFNTQERAHADSENDQIGH
jgi:hypothetical protein